MFDGTMRLSNKEYDEKLSDPNSQEFQNLSAIVESGVIAAFAATEGFIKCEVKGFRKGSVLCDFTIKMNKNSKLNENQLKEVILNSSKDGTFKNIKVADVSVKQVMDEKSTESGKTPMKAWEIFLIVLGAIIVSITVMCIVYWVGILNKQQQQLTTYFILIWITEINKTI